MKITVCELPDPRKSFQTAWADLVEHVYAERSELVVLPDMPFSAWFTDSDRFDRDVWADAVRDHDEWEHRLRELSPAIVLASRPVDFGNERYDEGFLWDEPLGMLSVHAKTFLPDAATDFTPLEVRGLRIGMLIGGEMWAPECYQASTVDVLGIPRAGDLPGRGDCLQRACALAQRAHAYAVSSNRSGTFGGQAWIVSPEGQLLAVTSADEPFVSLEVALRATQGESRHFDVFAH